MRAFSENLELKVRERIAELEHAKGEIEYALRELGVAQGALIDTERMAALGMLVAGIAHEVRSPAAAVQGLVDALQDTVEGGSGSARTILTRRSTPRSRCTATSSTSTASCPRSPPRHCRRRWSRARASALAEARVCGSPGGEVAAALLAESAGELGERSAGELRAMAAGQELEPLAGYLREIAFLARSAGTIRTAIGSIRRIVGASSATRVSMKHRSSGSTCTRGSKRRSSSSPIS